MELQLIECHGDAQAEHKVIFSGMLEPATPCIADLRGRKQMSRMPYVDEQNFKALFDAENCLVHILSPKLHGHKFKL